MQHESNIFELNFSIETKVAHPGNREQQIFKHILQRFVISKLSQPQGITFTHAKPPRTSREKGDAFGQQNQQIFSPGREPKRKT